MDAKPFNFHGKIQNQKPLSVHVNFTTSSHSNQTNLSVYERMRRHALNFHITKEKTTKMLYASPFGGITNLLPRTIDVKLFNFHVTKQKSKVAFGSCELHYFITLQPN
jgi:hypothetical protein